jgi:hypothetical protein
VLAIAYRCSKNDKNIFPHNAKEMTYDVNHCNTTTEANMDYDTWLEEPEQRAWDQHYRWEQEELRRLHDIELWIETEHSQIIWRVWDEVAGCSDDWCELSKQVTIAVLDGQDAKKIAHSFMTQHFATHYSFWEASLHQINKERGWK